MTPQQIEQMRMNSCRKGLTMYGEYVAGAMDASDEIAKRVKEYLEAEPRGITDEYPTFLQDILDIINE